MAIDFMVIALPRSGTTWAANWLTTERTVCRHDPLYTTHYADWDKSVLPGRMVGVSCTGIWRFPGFLAQHPARKVVLHRPLSAINESLAAIGLPECTQKDLDELDRIDGIHVDFRDLFDTQGAANIWSYLVGQGFDAIRHAELCQIEMQPKFSGLTVGPEVTRRLVEELRGAVE